MSPTNVLFDDREDAGKQLASLIKSLELTVDIVLGVPRGGMPVAYEVAKQIDCELGYVAAKKITSPNDSELAIGSVSAAGDIWMNEDVVGKMSLSEFEVEKQREKALRLAIGKDNRYSQFWDRPDFRGNGVLIVDDGIATGATVRACIRFVQNKDAKSAYVGVPVSDPGVVRELGIRSTQTITVYAPEGFESVSHYYRDFSQVSDQEAMSYLVF